MLKNWCNKIFYFSSGAIYKNLNKNRMIKETDPIYKNTKFQKKVITFQSLENQKLKQKN